MRGSIARCVDCLKVLGSTFHSVSKSVSLARLPDAVVAAFRSPLDIQFRWAAPLTEVLQKDPDGTLSRARAIAEARGDLSATAILSKLLGLPEPASGRAASQELTISKAGKVAAKLTVDAKGRALVRFEAGALPSPSARLWPRSSKTFSRLELNDDAAGSTREGAAATASLS